MLVALQIEVAGCPTICQHCWAQGVPYPSMPLVTIRDVLEAGQRFFTDRQVEFTAFPIQELATSSGDTDSTAIYFDAASVRYLWIDRWLRSKQH